MWFLLQSSIIFAVVASNIHWQWTPNGYLAGAIGVGLAFLVTACWNGLRGLTQGGSRDDKRL